MSSKSLKSQLTNTIKDTDLELKKRIQQAEALLDSKTPPSKNFSNKKEQDLSETSPQPNPIKVIKENYTMPESDYLLLETLRKKFASTGNILSKSETMRAGLLALAKLSENELVNIASNLVKLKPGRIPVKLKK